MLKNQDNTNDIQSKSPTVRLVGGGFLAIVFGVIGVGALLEQRAAAIPLGAMFVVASIFSLVKGIRDFRKLRRAR